MWLSKIINHMLEHVVEVSIIQCWRNSIIFLRIQNLSVKQINEKTIFLIRRFVLKKINSVAEENWTTRGRKMLRRHKSPYRGNLVSRQIKMPRQIERVYRWNLETSQSLDEDESRFCLALIFPRRRNKETVEKSLTHENPLHHQLV